NTAVGGWNNPTYPVCWNYFTTNASGYAYVYDYAQRTGTNGYYIYNYGNNINLVSPETVNLGAGSKRIRFWARTPYNYGSGFDFALYSMNENTATAAKTLLKTIPLTATWTEYIVYIPANTTDDYFAFVSNSTSGTLEVYLDDIYYEDAPNCRPIDDAT